MTIRSTIFAVAAAAAAIAAASPASAQEIEGVQVYYGDLNLDSAAGRAALDGRIARAARNLCGDYLLVELKWAHGSRVCQSEVIASAQTQRDAILGGDRFAGLVVSRAAS